MIGRRPERALVKSFLATPARDPRLLVITGQPGIGKTSLWLHTTDMARKEGHLVLTARPTKAEARLTFGVLADLLGEAIGWPTSRFADLPDAQRAALGRALGTVEGDTDANSLALTAATRTILRALSTDRPVLIAIDDLQWADEASIRVLESSLRRLPGTRIAVVACQRIGFGTHPADVASPLADLGAEVLELGPMSAADLASVLLRHLGRLPASRVGRITDESAANPFIALELGRLGEREGMPDVGVGRLAISDRLRRLARERVGLLDADGRAVGLLIAALAHPTSRRLAAASGNARLVRRGLEEAERAAVVELRGDEWAFTHPLLGSAIYDGAAAADRRDLHARLAKVATDVEERAWHLSLSTVGKDARVAAALSRAAEAALSRGAPDSALALFNEAIGRTPASSPTLGARRRVEAAKCLIMLDRPQSALEALGPVTYASVPKLIRADALRLAGLAALELHGPLAAAEYTKKALQVTDDPVRASLILERYADLLRPAGLQRHLAATLREGVRRARESGSPALLARARINQIAYRYQTGLVGSVPALRAIERLGEAIPPTPFPVRLHAMLAQVAHWGDAAAVAERHWQAVIDNAAAVGDEAERTQFLAYLADLEVRTGQWTRADAKIDEILELAAWSDAHAKSAHALCMRSLLQGLRGDVQEARDAAQRGLELASDYSWLQWRNLAALGVLELSLGNTPIAADHLSRAVAVDPTWLERRHGVCYMGIDWIEAMAAARRAGDVRGPLERLEAQARRWNEGWAIAGMARARAVVETADGRLEHAQIAAREAVLIHDTLPYPLEAGRSHLVAGSILRRMNHRRDARAALRRAAELFSGLGAPLWADRAAQELARVGGRAPGAGALTPSEAAIADLVKLGLTNAEVADRLILSVRTVESHLTHVYAKLGVRSRTELVRQLALAT
jgi:DNA-binding CsgD family transcriptional regulator